MMFAPWFVPVMGLPYLEMASGFLVFDDGVLEDTYLRGWRIIVIFNHYTFVPLLRAVSNVMLQSGSTHSRHLWNFPSEQMHPVLVSDW